MPFDVYSLEEIAAEKLRCVIQRVQCRDLYDIFRLVKDTHVSLATCDRYSSVKQLRRVLILHRSLVD